MKIEIVSVQCLKGFYVAQILNSRGRKIAETRMCASKQLAKREGAALAANLWRI